jgi:formylglycine-generating enzyme required for sulfatase activity
MLRLARFAVVGLLALVASTAIVIERAVSDDCVHSASCPEDNVDGRGCCRTPGSPEVSAPAVGVLRGNASATPASCPDDMVPVAAAAFLMGSAPGEGDKNEYPQHRVSLDGYCIDRTEVTVAAYARCVASGKCTAASPPEAAGPGSVCNGNRQDRQLHPINCVNWDQARAYCATVHKRLPGEAEWEYAARGPDRRIYPWGNDPAPRAGLLNACDAECMRLASRLRWDKQRAMYPGNDLWEATAPVGSFRDGASPFGALDMAGNVAEWTEDVYSDDYTGTASHFDDGLHRVVRGGAWNDGEARWVRGASRYSGLPAKPLVDVGFRCARSE